MSEIKAGCRGLKWLTSKATQYPACAVAKVARMVCCLALFSSNCALAQVEECPGGQGLPLPATQQEKSALALRLAKLENACANNPPYLAWYGALLHQLGRPAEAALLLERALLLDPDLAGARADYAEVLADLGDRSAARTLFNELLRRPDLPEHLGEPFRSRVLELTELTWQFSPALAIRHGYESNLNSAPASSTLDITLPSGRTEYSLDANYRARAGSATLYELALQASRQVEALARGGRLNLAAEVKARRASGAGDTDFLQADLLAQLVVPMDVGEWMIDSGTSYYRYDTTRLFQAMRGGLAYQIPLGNCRWRLGAEIEERQYPVNALLDGRFAAAASGARCLYADYATSWVLRLGEDRPLSADRPGGAQRRFDLRLTAVWPMLRGVVQAEGQLSSQSDVLGYSPLLESNAPRRVGRAAARIEYSYPLAQNLEGVLALEASRQRSNIALFDIDNNALWFGLRWSGK